MSKKQYKAYKRKLALQRKIQEYKEAFGVQLKEPTCAQDEARLRILFQKLKPVEKRTKPKKAKKKRQRRTYKNNDDFYNSREWMDVRYKALQLHGRQCLCCGAKAPGVELHVDHIKPRSKYPELELDINNLQVLCKACNLGKSNRDCNDYRQ